MTAKLKSNLYVGPVDNFPIFYTVDWCDIEQLGFSFCWKSSSSLRDWQQLTSYGVTEIYHCWQWQGNYFVRIICIRSLFDPMLIAREMIRYTSGLNVNNHVGSSRYFHEYDRYNINFEWTTTPNYDSSLRHLGAKRFTVYPSDIPDVY